MNSVMQLLQSHCSIRKFTDKAVDDGMIHGIVINKTKNPDMVKRRSGSILNVASTAAFQAGPLMSTYYASKAYVLLLSEGLNNEFAQDGVNVSFLCPGPTDTEFAARADMSSAKMINVPWIMSAAKVAEICFAGLMRGKKIIIPGLMNKLIAFSTRFTPRSVLVLITRSLNQKEAVSDVHKNA